MTDLPYIRNFSAESFNTSLQLSTKISLVENNDYNIEHILQSIVLLICGSFSSVGNYIIVAVISKYENLRNHEEAVVVYLILFLAIADGLNGFGAVIAAVYRLYVDISREIVTRAACLGFMSVWTMGNFCSQSMLIMVVVDRLIAVVNPMGHQSRNHFKYGYRSFLITAGYSLVSMMLQFVGDLTEPAVVCNGGASWTPWFRAYWLMFSIFVALVVIALYATMLVIVWCKKNDHSEHAQIQLKVTQTISIVLLIYILFWVTPLLVGIVIVVMGFGPKVLGFVGPFVLNGSNISGAANIFVYAYKIPIMRTYFKKFFGLNQNNSNSVAPAVSLSKLRSGNRAPNV